MRLKRTYILLLVLSVVAAASIFVMLAYYFREGVTPKKIEFDYKDTLKGSKYYKDGIVRIKGVKIPGQDAFDLNKDDTTDNKLYATQSGIQFIMKNVPPKIIENARIYKQMQKKQNNVPSNVKSSST